jgi:hypothetical protein
MPACVVMHLRILGFADPSGLSFLLIDADGSLGWIVPNKSIGWSKRDGETGQLVKALSPSVLHIIIFFSPLFDVFPLYSHD